MTMESSQTPPAPADPQSTSASVHRHNLQRAQQAVIDEFHALLDDTERLLKQGAEVSGEQADELRARIEGNLGRAREALQENEGRLREQGKAAMQATEAHVRNHPWQALGIAAGVGLLLGLLAGRR